MRASLSLLLAALAGSAAATYQYEDSTTTSSLYTPSYSNGTQASSTPSASSYLSSGYGTGASTGTNPGTYTPGTKTYHKTTLATSTIKVKTPTYYNSAPTIPLPTGAVYSLSTTVQGPSFTYSQLPTATVLTNSYTNVETKIITSFVPCSTPIATSSGTTYYSTYLTVTYYTTQITQASINVQTYYPTQTVGYCPPKETVYQPVYITVTVTAENPAGTPTYPAATTYITPSSSYPSSSATASTEAQSTKTHSTKKHTSTGTGGTGTATVTYYSSTGMPVVPTSSGKPQYTIYY